MQQQLPSHEARKAGAATVMPAPGVGAATDPDHRAAALDLGIALEAAGDLEAAAECYRAAAEAEPAAAVAFIKLANVLRRLGQFDAALLHADRGVALDPQHYGARVVRAMLRDLAGQSEGAREDFDRAVGLCPDTAQACNALGAICIDQGRAEQALGLFARAVRLAPGSAEAHGNLGLALMKQGRMREAFEACRQAVTLDPAHVRAQCNLAGLLIEIDHLDAAIATARLATRLAPDCVEALLHLGMALRRQGHDDEALEAFRQVLRHEPQRGEALAEICDLRQQSCDWPGLKDQQAAAIQFGSRKGKRIAPFQVLALTGSPSEQQGAARAWAAGFEQRGAPLSAYAPRPAGPGHERLRIGYLSADFRTHATAMLIAELLERHDRTGFETFAYSWAADDGSPMRRRLMGALDHFVDIRATSHMDAARRIRDDGIDILVDLKGYTREARTGILALRPAPIQVNYLGFPGTMGARFIDYIVADPVVVPPGKERFFDERVVRLPHSYQPNDSRRAMAASRPTRAECGLPAEAFVFCCFNNSYKITPEVFEIWMRFLRGTPGAVLWLFDGGGSVSRNLRQQAGCLGVRPDRLVFAPRTLPEHHLARLGLADLFLDTLPVNAHTTASEALWAGLPVLTCLGEAFASRVAGSLLHAVGLPELVTTSLSQYEALGFELAHDPGRLAGLRRALRDGRASAPLFDTPRYARNYESALRRMAELRDAGRPPEAFTVTEA